MMSDATFERLVSSPQEFLAFVYASGQSQKQQGGEAKPLTFLLWLTNFFVLDEALAQQVIEYYQAGYSGLVPMQR